MSGPSPRHGSAPDHAPTLGVTDLMTSLAVIFILLLTVYLKAFSESHAEAAGQKEDVKVLLRDHLQRFHLHLEDDPRDPLVLLVVVPEDLLNFEFGKSSLRPTAHRFLVDAMPFYVRTLCGPLREKIDSVVIEGHTDDLGEDVLNLKLSQERSLSVMVKTLDVIRTKEPAAYRCFEELASASGRGKQDLIYEPGNALNRDRSRRVIFKIRMRSVEQRLTQAASDTFGEPSHGEPVTFSDQAAGAASSFR